MKKAIPCLNRKIVGFVEAVAAARRLKVELSFIKMSHEGYYIPPNKSYNGKPHIFINADLPEEVQAKKIVHELTHHVCHVALNFVLISLDTTNLTELQKQERIRRHKFEYEAEIIEAISAIPAKDLKNATRGLFDMEDNLEENWFARLVANEKHGL